MSWFTRKPKATQKSYLQAGAEVVGHLFNRLGLGGRTLEQQTYTQEESVAISGFLNDFVAWGKQQAPPLFAVNADGQIFCHPDLDSSSLQGYTTSTALQRLYRSDAYKRRSAQEKLATALHAWVSFMDSGVLRDMIPMLRELGWEDEVGRVSQVLSDFPPHDSNDKFLSSCKSLLILKKDPPPS
jgi:hypothetical protein